MFLFIFGVSIIFLLLLSLWWCKEFYKWNRYLHVFNGPRPLPIIGNILNFGSKSEYLKSMLRITGKYGGITKIWLANRPRLLLSDSKSVEVILNSSVNIDKSYDYRFFHSWLGMGLLTSSGTKWRQQRKLLTYSFHFNILERFIEVFYKQSNVLVDKLQENVEKQSFDIYPFTNLCALDIMIETAMGIPANIQNGSESQYTQSVKHMCRILTERTYSVIKMWDFFYRFTEDYQIQQNALKILHNYTIGIIIKRRQDILSANAYQPSTHGDLTKERKTFLDTLLQSTIDGEPLSDQVIREEVDTFMFEGHDTITSAISFTLYTLSKHCDVQNKVVEELQTIFRNESRIPANADLHAMKYMEMVIKESLRMYPPVPQVGRVLIEDVLIDGKILPKGLTVMIFTAGLHQQQEEFPNPDVFDPERFSLNNCKKRSPYAYVPFSAGPRNCIGQKFAMMEMKTIISTILRNFEILPDINHEPKLLAFAILQSETGLFLRLKKRLI